jgi:hypothetical protein
MADFLKIEDTEGRLRRVNAGSIAQYLPSDRAEGWTRIFLRGELCASNPFDTRHSPEAIDKALSSPGLIATLT